MIFGQPVLTKSGLMETARNLLFTLLASNRILKEGIAGKVSRTLHGRLQRLQESYQTRFQPPGAYNPLNGQRYFAPNKTSDLRVRALPT
jgi:hypothetical protein